MKRVKSVIKPWFGRFRAEILVDDHLILKAFSVSEEDAKKWCKEQEERLREEVREA